MTVQMISLPSNNLVGNAGATLAPLAPTLEVLDLSGNSLTGIDLSALTALKTLVCSTNNISALDVSALTSLEALSCYNNNISTLDVSALTALKVLRCYNNNISTLDVSGLTALETLLAQDNELPQSVVDQILVDLDTNGIEDGTVNVSGNAIPSAAGLAAKTSLEAKGWTVTVDS